MGCTGNVRAMDGLYIHAYVHCLNGHIYNFKVDLMGSLLTIQPPYKIALIRKSNSIVQ